jgi:membrane protein required for colicin V production
MNVFDAIVFGVTLVAVVMGYQSGLLRSLATILGYAMAMPLAVALMPTLAPYLPTNNYFMFVVVFLVLAVLLAAGFRSALSQTAGEDIRGFDRVAGALLGAVRIGLLAVLMVLIFDRIIPPNLRPPWLTESQLRPYLAMAAERGLRTLPPDVTDYIDRMKREHGL